MTPHEAAQELIRIAQNDYMGCSGGMYDDGKLLLEIAEMLEGNKNGQ